MGKTRPSKKINKNPNKSSKNKKPLKTKAKKIKGQKMQKQKKKWRNPNKSEEGTRPAGIKEVPKVPVKIKKGNEKLSLREKMMKRLDAARFRQLNEDLDSVKNANPMEAFGSEEQVFAKYHEAYRERVESWPVDPLSLIISWVKETVPVSFKIADFGCGEARLAQSVPHTVHSFDLFALNEHVTACDMSECPLEDESVEVAIYCLSLMGIDIGKFICEANRVLKKRGILKIAEVASRFQNTTYASFVQKMKKFGFVINAEKDNDSQSLQSNGDVFFMFEFKKIRPVNQVNGKIPSLKLSPCIYKRR
jgi:ribosomal RNA-processing protein 8